MRIAIDISPVGKSSKSAHKVRGVGSYINFLVENLPKFDKENEYIFVENDVFPKDADLIHYPYFDPFFITLPLASSKKFVVTVHDLTPLVFPEHFPAGVKGKLKWSVQKQLLKGAKRVLADSDCSKKDIVSIANIPPDKIDVIYLAVGDNFKEKINEASIEKVSKKYSLPTKFVLYVGDATWNKNLPRLIEATKKTDYKLVIVGKVWESEVSNIPNNPWNHDLIEILNKIKDDKQFVNLGFVPDEDIASVYRAATTLIMPSIYEGFGLPIVEAMSVGCPVVSSRGGSLDEVGADAVLRVDQLSVDSIAEGISKIMSDKELRSDLIKKGLIYSGKFDKEKIVQQIVHAYKIAM